MQNQWEAWSTVVKTIYIAGDSPLKQFPTITHTLTFNVEKLSKQGCWHTIRIIFRKNGLGGILALARTGDEWKEKKNTIKFKLTDGTRRRPQPHGRGQNGTKHLGGAGQGRSVPGDWPGRWSPGHPLWGPRVERKLLHCTQAHAEAWKMKQLIICGHQHSWDKDDPMLLQEYLCLQHSNQLETGYLQCHKASSEQMSGCARAIGLPELGTFSTNST